MNQPPPRCSACGVLLSGPGDPALDWGPLAPWYERFIHFACLDELVATAEADEGDNCPICQAMGVRVTEDGRIVDLGAS